MEQFEYFQAVLFSGDLHRKRLDGSSESKFPEPKLTLLLHMMTFCFDSHIDKTKQTNKKKPSTSISVGGIPACQLFWFLPCFHYFVKGDIKRKEGGSNRERRRERHIQSERLGVRQFSEPRTVSVYLLSFWGWMDGTGWREMGRRVQIV